MAIKCLGRNIKLVPVEFWQMKSVETKAKCIYSSDDFKSSDELVEDRNIS
jgi:hypothetical protein